VPEPYRSSDWALVPAKTGPRAEYYYIYIYIYITAIGLTPGGSSTAQINTQTVHRIKRTEHI
jgi:hypothetical protein